MYAWYIQNDNVSDYNSIINDTYIPKLGAKFFKE